MHEYGITEDLVNGLLQECESRSITRVTSVTFRRGSAFSDEALQQTFAAVTRGTPAEGATLVVDIINLDYLCTCGYRQVVTCDDLEGHMYVCPTCGSVHDVLEAHDLELVSFTAEVQASSPVQGGSAL